MLFYCKDNENKLYQYSLNEEEEKIFDNGRLTELISKAEDNITYEPLASKVYLLRLRVFDKTLKNIESVLANLVPTKETKKKVIKALENFILDLNKFFDASLVNSDKPNTGYKENFIEYKKNVELFLQKVIKKEF